MLALGTEGEYDWLVTDDDFDLVQLCPEIVLGKYVAITSIDSGALVLSDEEVAAGWQSRGKIAYSPKVQNPPRLPHEGWDEWYIFEKPTDLGISDIAENIFELPPRQDHVSVFVNYAFALHKPEMKSLTTRFWKQIARIQPESYVADSTWLNFVTQNRRLFTTVHDAVKALI